ncbi:unnamed protein product [Durusdinium trenchii]|uniref:Inosine/uridine-preferring nucleoside hydrolase domain-containing protein n=1 Tax=Durusdinium trenchii TaxID=1381693 RepID=A0ABP0LQZ3_9DINO
MEGGEQQASDFQDLDLIVDTDMGLDDMAALLMLVTAGARLCLVTTVHGVCAAPLAAPLAQRLLLGVDGSARVVPGAAQSFSAAAELPSWVERHRAKLENVSELLNLPELPEVVSKETPRNQTALTAFLELDIKGVTLLALGPLTNVAAAAKADLSKFREVVGKIIVAGDNTKANPFNFRLDPMALDVVLNSGVPIHMVGTCCRPDATQLDGCLDKSLDHPMLLKILEQHPLSLVQDPVTAAYFLAPEIFRIAPLEVRGSADPVSVMEAKELDIAAYAKLLAKCFASQTKTLEESRGQLC